MRDLGDHRVEQTLQRRDMAQPKPHIDVRTPWHASHIAHCREAPLAPVACESSAYSPGPAPGVYGYAAERLVLWGAL